jgi:hypothetical protein
VLVLVVCLCPSSVRVAATFPGIILFQKLFVGKPNEFIKITRYLRNYKKNIFTYNIQRGSNMTGTDFF